MFSWSGAEDYPIRSALDGDGTYDALPVARKQHALGDFLEHTEVCSPAWCPANPPSDEETVTLPERATNQPENSRKSTIDWLKINQ